MDIRVIEGDITKLQVDAIVNAAKTSLLGGGGVDGAIHNAAGPKLLEECRTLNGCETGEAKITKGYDLPATYVIHTPGPIWRGGGYGEEALLASCYRNCFSLAKAHGVKTLAYPSISTGIYRFPKALAAKVAVKTLRDCAAQSGSVREVLLVCFDQESARLCSAALGEETAGV